MSGRRVFDGLDYALLTQPGNLSRAESRKRHEMAAAPLRAALEESQENARARMAQTTEDRERARAEYSESLRENPPAVGDRLQALGFGPCVVVSLPRKGSAWYRCELENPAGHVARVNMAQFIPLEN